MGNCVKLFGGEFEGKRLLGSTWRDEMTILKFILSNKTEWHEKFYIGQKIDKL